MKMMKMAASSLGSSRTLPLFVFCPYLFYFCRFTFDMVRNMQADRPYSAIQYSREELLQLRNFVDKNNPPTDNGDSPWLPVAVLPERRRRKTKRGSRAGLLVRLRKRENRPPLPSILLANVQPIENKLDELRSRIAFQREIKNCNVIKKLHDSRAARL